MPNALLQPDVSSFADPVGNALLAKGWDATQAYAPIEAAQNIAINSQVMRLRDVQIGQEQLKLGQQRLGALHDQLGGLVNNPTYNNFQDQLHYLVQNGIVPPDAAAQEATKVAGFNIGDPDAPNPQIKQYAFDHMSQVADHASRIQEAYGTPSLVNVGGSLQSVRSVQGPGVGTYAAGGAPLATTLSPPEKVAAGRTVTNGVGGQGYVPGSTLYDDRGNYIGGQGAGDGSGDSFVDTANGLGGRRAPPPLVGGNKSPPLAQNAPPPAPPAAAPGQGQGVAPAQSAAPQGQGAGPGAAGALVTPTPQTLPVITRDQAVAASNAMQLGKATAVDRNIFRGYAVQNNMDLGKIGPFEPQPAGVGAAAPVPGRLAGAGAPGAAPASAGAGAAPASVGTVPPGRQPPAPVQVGGGRPSAAGQGVGSGIGPGGITTALSPGQQASLAAGSNGYAALSSDVSSPGGVNQRLFQLRTALGALRNTQTGLGTAQRQQLVGYMASLPGGLDKWMPGVDPNSATAYDVATKYLNAYSLNTPGAARSDAGLSTAQSANANTSSMMQRAAMDVTSSNIGLEVGKQALLNAFEKSGADPGTFNKFAAQWGQGNDPRAFALGDMTPGERATLFNGLQGQQRTNFLATIRKGMAAGVLHKSDLTGATGNGQ